MKPTRNHLVGVAAALVTVAVAVPVSTASAVAPVPLAAADYPGWGGFETITPPVIGGVAGGVLVVGPTVITTAPSVFTNVNNQDSAGDNWAGPQVAPW